MSRVQCEVVCDFFFLNLFCVDQKDLKILSSFSVRSIGHRRHCGLELIVEVPLIIGYLIFICGVQ